MIILEEKEVIENIQIKNFNKLGKKYQLNIKKLYIYQFLMGFYLISGILIPFYLTWGHLNILEFNLLQSYYFIITFLLEIPCGAIGDRISRKKLLFLAGFFSALGALIYGLIPNILIFYVGETLFALGNALFSGSNEGLTYNSLKAIGKEEKFSEIMGKSNSIYLLGILISSPIGSLIGYNFSLQIVMLLMFIPYIGCSIISLTIKNPPFKKKKISSKFFYPIKSTLKSFKENRTIKILIIDMFIIEVLILILSLNYQFYLYTELNIPIFYYGFINAGIILSELILTYSISTHKARIRNKKMFLFFISILPGIFYILIGIIHFAPLNLFFILLILGLGLSRYILFYEAINKRIKDGTRATTYSMINMIRMVPGALILPLFGMFIISNINGTFILIGITIIALTIVSKVRKEHF